MAGKKQPQDHLSKPKPFGFNHDGKRYTLPPASKALGKVPGRALRDAVVDGGEAEVRLGFLCLEAVGAKPEALDALYAKPVGEMSDIVGRWMNARESADQETLPES